MATDNNFISDRTLERYILGELPANMLREVAKRVQTSATIKKRVETIRQSNDQFFDKYPAHAIVPAIIHQANQKKRVKRERHFASLFKGKYLVPVLASLFLVIMLTPSLLQKATPTITDPHLTDTTRIKGDSAKIYIYRKVGAKKGEALPSGSQVKEKDLLQISYSVIKNSYGVILSIDGRSKVTLHYPEKIFFSTKLNKNKETLLKRSYELDDAPKFEKFFFLTSLKPFNIQDILKKAQRFAQDLDNVRNRTLPLEKKYKQTSILLIKAGN